MKPKNIYLLGFMASGKSTVGPLLAQALGRGWEFVDGDRLLEERTGTAVARLLARGEERFRRLETELLAELAAREGLVVAVGGGAPALERNWPHLQRGITIYLDTPARTLIRRLAHLERPLLQGFSGEARAARIRRLLEERRPYYARAQLRVPCAGLAPEGVVRAILEGLRRLNQKG